MMTKKNALGFDSALIGAVAAHGDENDMSTNIISDDRMLLVLAAPSVHDTYYKNAFSRIVDFQVRYAKTAMGNDNVLIITDADTKALYEGRLPEDILLVGDILDIWARDFTMVNPLSPVQFRYTDASTTQNKLIQESFNAFANRHDVKRNRSELLIDGGNVVDNYAGRIISGERFLEDNRLNRPAGKRVLGKLLGAQEVAIIPPDEEVLAHADGMVMWLDTNTLLVNDYTAANDKYHQSVLSELKESFPSVKIVTTPMRYRPNPPGVWKGFNSACGVHVNSAVTFKNIYVPVFNMPHDNAALSIIRQNTAKNVFPINAEDVCPMGGGVRCLTWQLTGENAEKLILAARKD